MDLTFELVIKGGDVLTDSGWQTKLDVAVAEGRIAALAAGLKGKREVDAAGLHVVPGFVDTHVHGAAGSEDPEEMARHLPRTGVTAFVPTLATNAADDTQTFVERVAGLRPRDRAAEVLGSHLEGPWLSPEQRGAHPPAHIRKPEIEEAQRLLAASKATLRRVTIAPELVGAQSVIELLSKAQVQVSLGHSACSFEQAMEATSWGASSVTHVYDAMSPFHHREPGLVGAALASEQLLCELIADGVHVHAAAALALIRARSAEAVAIVSDALPPMSLSPGNYAWAGQAVACDGVVCRMENGTLAGSASSMLVGVRNLVSWGVSMADACRMAARTGARLAGAHKRKGAIAEGFDADLALLDHRLDLVETYCRGALAWRRGDLSQ